MSSDPAEKPGSRKAMRDSMFLAVEIEQPDTGERFSARARNVSDGGLMADEHDGLGVGDRVVVSLRGVGRVEGKVAWVRDGGIGIAFDERIDPRQTRKPVNGAKPTAAPRGPLFPRASG